jgi:hypothetical protein
MGYYKTPPHLLPLIAKYLKVLDPQDTRLFDPCCGTGEALALLGDALGVARTHCYGNELDEQRYEATKVFGIQSVCGDAIGGLDVTPRYFGVGYFNPPYDNEGEGSGERTEMKFIKATERFVMVNGVIILVFPEKVFRRYDVAEHLSYVLKDVKLFRFPETDYKAFGQAVLIGRKQRGKSQSDSDAYMAALTNPLTLGDDVDRPWIVPGSDKPMPTFFSYSLAQDHLGVVAGLPQLDRLRNRNLSRYRDEKIKTAMDLKEAHFFLVLLTSTLNGVYREPGTGDLIVLDGKTEKKVVKSEEKTEDATIYRNRHIHCPSVRALNLTESVRAGELVMIQYE